MKSKLIGWLGDVMAIILLATFCFPANARESSAREETLILHASMVRIKAMEKASGIKFKKVVPIKLDDCINPDNGEKLVGRYDPVIETIFISFDVWDSVLKQLNKPLDKISFQELAQNKRFQAIIDHELGHALMDQASRRAGKGSWITQKEINKLNSSRKTGVDVLSEGVAEWFTALSNPRFPQLTSESFPKNYQEATLYFRVTISYDGGHWMVRDILNRYGEKGLVWMIANPPSFDTSYMRRDAVAYRENALLELSKSLSPTH